MWNSRNKFNAVKVTYDGYKFDSKKECARYVELSYMLEAKEIEGLEVHPKYQFVINDIKICQWTADFSYFRKGEKKRVVEDVKSKGTLTRESRLKHKMFKALFPEFELLITGLD